MIVPQVRLVYFDEYRNKYFSVQQFINDAVRVLAGDVNVSNIKISYVDNTMCAILYDYNFLEDEISSSDDIPDDSDS